MVTGDKTKVAEWLLYVTLVSKSGNGQATIVFVGICGEYSPRLCYVLPSLSTLVETLHIIYTDYRVIQWVPTTVLGFQIVDDKR